MIIYLSMLGATYFVYHVKLHDPFEYIATWIGIVATVTLIDIAWSLREITS